MTHANAALTPSTDCGWPGRWSKTVGLRPTQRRCSICRPRLLASGPSATSSAANQPCKTAAHAPIAAHDGPHCRWCARSSDAAPLNPRDLPSYAGKLVDYFATHIDRYRFLGWGRLELALRASEDAAATSGPTGNGYSSTVEGAASVAASDPYGQSMIAKVVKLRQAQDAGHLDPAWARRRAGPGQPARLHHRQSARTRRPGTAGRRRHQHRRTPSCRRPRRQRPLPTRGAGRRRLRRRCTG